MVKLSMFLSAVLTLLTLPQLSFSAPALLLELDKTETELGLPITVLIYAIELPRSLDEINLQPLQNDFGVVNDDQSEQVEDKRWPGTSVQRLRFQIYPKTTGKLQLPELSFDNISSKSQWLSVKPGLIRDSSIEFNSNVSTLVPWERQQVILSVAITTPEPFATLVSTKPSLPGFEIIALPATRDNIMVSGKKYSLLHIGWALFPLIAGEHKISLPPIDYDRSGRIQRRYFLPSQTISVKKLPVYIPPTIPVGKFTVHSSLEGPDILNTKTLTYWHISMVGPSLTTHWLPPLLRQIHSNRHIDVLHTKTEKTINPNINGSNGRVQHTIAIKSLSSGKLPLPTLHFQYFDPDKGRLVALDHQPDRPYVISTILRWLIGSSLVGLLTWICIRIISLIRTHYHLRQQRQLALSRIEHAKSITELRLSLKLIADAEGWPTNLSLRDLEIYWNQTFQTEPAFSTLRDQLSTACYENPAGYSVEMPTFNNLRQDLVSAYRSHI